MALYGLQYNYFPNVTTDFLHPYNNMSKIKYKNTYESIINFFPYFFPKIGYFSAPGKVPNPLMGSIIPVHSSFNWTL